MVCESIDDRVRRERTAALFSLHTPARSRSIQLEDVWGGRCRVRQRGVDVGGARQNLTTWKKNEIQNFLEGTGGEVRPKLPKGKATNGTKAKQKKLKGALALYCI